MTLADAAILLMCGFVIGVEHRWRSLMNRRAALLDDAQAQFVAATRELTELVLDLQVEIDLAREARNAR